MDKLKHSFGRHFLIELIGCPAEKISRVEQVKPVLLQAAEVSRATVVEHFFKQYEPHGVTGVILIAESHFSVHTWPEDEFVAFDILTCGEMLPEQAVEHVRREFGARDMKQRILERGY
ncbi:MAG: adenosylmethionine decarboxylase [Candidatus Omnitrophica bacterium]|nr:adenosylmethionine decarboxylase [Candidatus Omnitrophota bacterium]